MENRKQLIVTGAFLLIGTFVILVTILMLGGDKVLFQKTTNLHVYFDQVQGLNRGSVVSLSGLPIGNIQAFELDPKNQKIKVTLRIHGENISTLTEGTNAEIRTQGALGDKFVYLTAGPADAAPLKNGAEIQAAKSTDIMAILSEKSSETERIFDIIKEVHLLTKTLNHENKLGKILDNMERGSKSFDKMATTAENSMYKLERVMTKLDRGEGTLGALISDPSIHDQLKSMLGASQRKNQVKDMLRKSTDK